jgi:hypothetical protein
MNLYSPLIFFHVWLNAWFHLVLEAQMGRF